MKTLAQREIGRRASSSAFGMLDLVASVSIISVLLVVGQAKLSTTKTRAYRITCVNNLKNLGLAVRIFETDNQDTFPPNNKVADSKSQVGRTNWVNGRLDFNPKNTDNTNISMLASSPLAGLANELLSPRMFKCPADASSVTIGGKAHPRVRSYVMNGHIGKRVEPYESAFLHAEKSWDVPPTTFIISEQSTNTIDDGAFHVSMKGYSLKDPEPEQYGLSDFPTSRHGAGGNFAMADGSVHSQAWKDERIAKLEASAKPIGWTRLPGSPAVRWLQTSSVPKDYQFVRLYVTIQPAEARGARVEWTPDAIDDWQEWTPDYAPVGFGYTRVKAQKAGWKPAERSLATREEKVRLTITMEQDK